jgi:hypothetical protein
VTPYRDQVASALGALALTGTAYSWFGEPAPPLRRAVAATLPPAVVRDYLLERLTTELYGSFYTRGAPVPHHPRDAVPARADRAFVAALSAANGGAGGWDHGWIAEAGSGRWITVVRDGLRVTAPSSAVEPPSARPGDAVRLRRGNEQVRRAPGFYIALGDADWHEGGDVELRVYLHVTAAGAAPLVAAATRALNERGVPFSLKLAGHPAAYARCDAGVLYLRRGDFGGARAVLRELIATCAPYLHPAVPALTRPVAPGVAVAEHVPGHGGSFGTSRCRLVAEGALEAHERNATALRARVDAVAARFAARGLDIDAPYLAPGSGDVYAL